MNFKKHMGFMIACGIVALLIIVTGVMVFFGARQYSVENAAYQSSLSRFNQLCKRDPFPSETNVTQELENVMELTNLVSQLSMDLRKGQVEARKMAPEAFISHIQNMARNLSKRMGEAGVQLPAPNYDFDFDKYVSKGIPPNPSHISGLNYQFQLVEIFCGILADAKIAEIKMVKRDRFDESTPAPVSTRGTRGAARSQPAAQNNPDSSAPGMDSIDAVKPGELFSKIHFSLQFVGREDSIWTVLNQMAQNRVFIVITRVKMTNPRLTLSAPSLPSTAKPDAAVDAAAQPAPAGGPESEPQIVPRANRIVVGNELIEVEMELDVYRFATPGLPAAAPAGKKK